MSTPTLSTATDADALAEVAGDTALVALLRGKPANDEVPASVWWLLAEALRTSVAVRRLLVVGPNDPEDVRLLLTEADLLTGAALDELAEATGARPVPVGVAPRPWAGGVVSLHRSILGLARLLVSHRPTSARYLADALSAHSRALRAC